MRWWDSWLGRKAPERERPSEDARRAQLLRRWREFEGVVADHEKPLRILSDGQDDNVLTPYPRMIVERGAEYLFGQPPGVQIGSEAVEPADEYLEEVWPSAQRAADLYDLALNGGVFGDAYLGLGVVGGRPVVTVIDPINVAARWSPRDYRQVEAFSVTTPLRDETRRETYERDAGGRWRIRVERSADGKRWTTESDSLWPYAFCPIVHAKNLPTPNEFFGRPDLTPPVMGLVRALWRVDSIVNRIVKSHGFPKTVITGARRADVDLTSDRVLFLTNPQSSIKNVELSGDLPLALALRRTLRAALSEATHLPEITFGNLEGVGQLSGLALGILYGPLVSRTLTKRRLYGAAVTETVRRLLAMGGYGNLPVRLAWGDITPSDAAAAAAQTRENYKAGLVSRRTAMEQLGFDAEIEEERLKAEMEAARALEEQLLNLRDEV